MRSPAAGEATRGERLAVMAAEEAAEVVAAVTAAAVEAAAETEVVATVATVEAAAEVTEAQEAVTAEAGSMAPRRGTTRDTRTQDARCPPQSRSHNHPTD
eukprot:3960507-Pleurochrysis_carterae.AAC.1